MVYCSGRALICFLFCHAVAFHHVDDSKHTKGHNTPNYQIVYPRRVNFKGKHLTYTIPHTYRLFDANSDIEKRSADKIHYKMNINGADQHIILKPNKNVLTSGLIIELQEDNDPLLSKMRRHRKHCHYKGHIKKDEDSNVAISTCNGLAGYIRTKDSSYLLEPIAGHNVTSNEPYPHMLYKQEKMGSKPNCVVGNKNVLSKKSPEDSNLDRKHTVEQDVSPDEETTTTPPIEELHIETLVVIDHSFLAFHKAIEVEDFVLTIFNMVHNFFHDSSLGKNINVAIVRLIRLEIEDHEMNIGITKDIEKTLEYFCKWQNKINPIYDDHPNHHDLAVLLTSYHSELARQRAAHENPMFVHYASRTLRIDICGDDKTCGLLGASRLAGICDPLNQAILVQDNGLRAAFTLAHEIGHVLGLQHDQFPVALKGTTIMGPYITAKMNVWSDCSRALLKTFLDSGFGKCMYDPPTDHSFILVDTQPGVMYDGDYQCQEIFGAKAALCMTGVECNNLICYIEDKGCVESHVEAAEGTSCGENKWCFRGECVQVGERPQAVDGGWSDWSPWSSCTRTCGSGVMSSVRHCVNPKPSKGGKYCTGEFKRHRVCTTEPCESLIPSFRDIQCSEFNSWVYPADNKLHDWKSYLIHYENPCALYCANELGEVAALRPRVIDGTTCYRGNRNICIDGLCKEIPCDLDLESNAIEDRCGVCKGDGTSCNIVRGEEFFVCNKLGERKFIEIPRGALNIKIEEMTPSESRIEIKTRDGTNTFITGEEPGIFNIWSSKAWVGMIRTKQEAINILGPLADPISVWISVQQNSTIKYSYGVPTSKKRIPSFSWDFLQWSQCSTDCGPGTQEAVPKCVEKLGGLVDEKYCLNIKRPQDKIRDCEIKACAPRWFVGDWQECSKCPWGTRFRLVKCFNPVGNGEGELDIIADSYCTLSKPKTSEICNCLDNVGNSLITEGPPSELLPSVKNEIDFYRIEHIKLTVHSELENNRFPVGLPHPKNVNSSTFIIQGKEALKFLSKIEQDLSNNKTNRKI